MIICDELTAFISVVKLLSSGLALHHWINSCTDKSHVHTVLYR